MSEKKVKKVVALMRHGIRSPNQSMETLASWSKREWPVWPVPPGHLTGRGRELLTYFWRTYRAEEPYRSLLYGEGRCVTPNDIFIHADVDQRTQASAAVFAATIAPECQLSYFITTEDKLDPVYHPVRGTVCKYSRDEVEDEIIELVGGEFDRLAEEYSSQLEFVNQLLGPMPYLTCKEYGVEPSCELVDLPPRVNFANSGRTVNVRGALGIKATLIQNWLLESAQWPGKNAGWGEITRPHLEELLIARSAIFNCLNRADGYSRDRGSAILKAMTDSLCNIYTEQQANNARMVMFAGHDTNMAHISDLLGMEWDLEGYAYNDIPPGSFLQFLLWEDETGQESVTAELVAQPLDVLLSAYPEQVIPSVIVKKLPFKPQKSSQPAVYEYSLKEFRAAVDSVINLDCIPPSGRLQKGIVV